MSLRLFRQIAVDRFLGPIETDSLRSLAPPRRWLLATGLVSLLAALLLWA